MGSISKSRAMVLFSGRIVFFRGNSDPKFSLYYSIQKINLISHHFSDELLNFSKLALFQANLVNWPSENIIKYIHVFSVRSVEKFFPNKIRRFKNITPWFFPKVSIRGVVAIYIFHIRNFLHAMKLIFELVKTRLYFDLRFLIVKTMQKSKK